MVSELVLDMTMSRYCDEILEASLYKPQRRREKGDEQVSATRGKRERNTRERGRERQERESDDRERMRENI